MCSGDAFEEYNATMHFVLIFLLYLGINGLMRELGQRSNQYAVAKNPILMSYAIKYVTAIGRQEFYLMASLCEALSSPITVQFLLSSPFLISDTSVSPVFANFRENSRENYLVTIK